MKVGFLFICVAYAYLRRATDALVHFLITPKNQVRSQEGANVTLWWDYTSDKPLTLAQWGTVNDDDNLESIIAQQSSSGDIKYTSTNFKDRAFIEGRATLHLLNVKVGDSGRYGCEIFFQGQSSPTLKNVTELIVSEGSTTVPLTSGETTDDDNTNTKPVYMALVIVMVILIVLVVVYLYTTRRRGATRIDKRNSQVFGPSMELNNMKQDEPNQNANEMGQSPTRETLDNSLRDYSVIPPITPGQVKKDWEIPRDSLVFVKVIGKGAFGQVAKGMAQGIGNSKENQLVAIKMLRKNATDENRQHLLSELNMMKSLEQHSNVIELLGCVTKSDPVMVITEYAPYGDLLGFLRKSRGLHDTYYDDPDIKPLSSLNSKQLFRFASDIANGMEFLSSNKIIHRDLAARNVLVGEEEVCKITDFGMAKDVFKEDLYRRTTTGRLPVKWTALESLVYGVCTTMSDLWSYGIVMYEIFTIGGSPYPKIEGKSLASLLQEGYRMPKPPHLDKKLYDVMVSCWNETPEKRPSFAELCKRMEQMQDQKEIYVNLKSYDTNLYQIADEQDA